MSDSKEKDRRWWSPASDARERRLEALYIFKLPCSPSSVGALIRWFNASTLDERDWMLHHEDYKAWFASIGTSDMVDTMSALIPLKAAER